jgi:catechol 2,3-dioxygenase-like lactoylglutathione lyase family enzyme
MLNTIDHIAIQVQDVAQALAWYHQHFTCETLYQDPTWALLGFANVRLALVVAGQHPPHIALTRDDAASFGPLTTHRDGTRSIYIEDPSSNAIEIMASDIEPGA